MTAQMSTNVSAVYFDRLVDTLDHADEAPTPAKVAKRIDKSGGIPSRT